MEWVETTGRTVEEAKRSALEQLGVEESDADFEVISEPKIGLFGRLKEEARVRARVQPKYPRSKGERRERRRTRAGRPEQSSLAPAQPGPGTTTEDPSVQARRRTRTEESAPRGPGEAGPRRRRRTGGAGSPMGTSDKASNNPNDQGPSSDDVVSAAEEFLRGLLREIGAEAEISSSQPSDDILEILISGDGLGTLIGPKGATLAALQELTRIVLQRQTPRAEHRVVVDVNGYRRRRSEALARFAQQVAADVLATNKKRALEPMPPADRKVVHDAVSGTPGVTTISEGEEPNRRVVLVPVAALEGDTAPSGDEDLQSAHS